MRKGKFITIDGVEGAGKSTQIDFICQYLTDEEAHLIAKSYQV
jgi:dTMP kinase